MRTTAYAEIYKNPTKIEWTKVGHKQHAPWSLEEDYGKMCYYAGGILTSKDLYVFDRENAEHHSASYEISKLEPNWFPLYCYFFYIPDVLAISASSFSFSDADNKKLEKSTASDPELSIMRRRVKGHPQLKKFKKIVTYDGDTITI
jgi:hypothetical protein